MAALFKIVYFAGLIVEMIVRIPHDRRRRRIPKADRRITRGETALFGVLSLAMIGLPLLYTFTPWLDFADFGWGPDVRAVAGGIGTLFMAGALWIFWRAHRDLGVNWSPSLEINAEHRLVTEGIYRTIRHPMYTSQLLWGLAQILLLPNWIAGPAGLLTFVLLYLFRVPPEERMMSDHFGDAYRVYAERTGRIVPRLK
jgi:protein-S-isoprenylcysteine O-methyltransferase Ste14